MKLLNWKWNVHWNRENWEKDKGRIFDKNDIIFSFHFLN